MVTVHIIIYLGYGVAKKEQVNIVVQKYKDTLHYIHGKLIKPPQPGVPPLNPPQPPSFIRELQQNDRLNSELKKYDMQISTLSHKTIEQKSSLVGIGRDWKLYEYKGNNYFYIWDRADTLLVKDNQKNLDKTQYIIFLTIILNMVFILFYLFLLKKLRPLATLKRSIVRFSKGDLEIDTSCDGKDEICEVSNEFNKAIIQIKSLTNSRDLFLRNILHELKTPITKGFLITDVMKRNRYKNDLKDLFLRLDYLLKEFAKLEEFTAKNSKLTKEEFRLVDIIDHALDILLCDTQCVDLKASENILVKVDFGLFSLAIKNLLDNALKYGIGKPEVILKNNTLYIKNSGKKLSKSIEQYNKPFDKQYKNSNSGLGLGLYLVNNILNAHNLKLQYRFEDENNVFFIKFDNDKKDNKI